MSPISGLRRANTISILQVIATETDSIEKYSVNKTVIVNITNINDNDPMFNKSQYNFTVNEGDSVGTVLGQIMVG
jgi:hypothetical protein